MTSPDYSSYARTYAQARPTYPRELFLYLASLIDRRKCAWDCATGNGQAALGLAEHFDTVIATDMSSEQIHHAIEHPRVEYRVATAERSGLPDGSIDLVTVASAIHWFDLQKFYSEVGRVLRTGGVLSAWTYHIGYVEPPFDDLCLHFYRDVIYPYFPPGARIVDDRYSAIELPGENLEPQRFFVSANWRLDQMLAFMHSWSGTQEYMKEQGRDPILFVEKDLAELWGDPGSTQIVRWPIFLRVSRL